MKKRSEIEEKYKWDLSSYCTDDNSFLMQYNYLKEHIKDLVAYKNKLSDEKELISCLKLEEDLSLKLGVLYVYSVLKIREDASNAHNKENLTLVESLSNKFSSETSFIDVEVKKYKTEDLKRLEKTTSFKNYFKGIIKSRKLILSEKEEKIIAKSSDFAGGYSDVFDMFNDGDLKFNDVKDSAGKKYKLNHSNYIELMESKDRTLRKNTLKEMNGAYGRFNNFLSSNYINNVKKDVFYARLRKFNSTLDYEIFLEDVSRKVYDNLIKSVRENLPVLHDYYEIKKKYLNLNKFAIYDQFAKNITIQKKYTYAEAIEIIKNATKPLGEEYQNLIDRAVNERWIDVYPNENKDSGAFSWGAYLKNPVVLTNFVGDTNSVFTLAHELGHAMHTYYSNTTQTPDSAGYTIYVAEVASNVNEMLLLKYFIENAENSKDVAYFYDYFLTELKGSVFRQIMFAEFEQFAHEQFENEMPISSKVLNEYYLELNKIYFGKNVELIPEIQYEWSRIPHFYNSFYVYKYAIGLISAIYIVYNVLPNNPEKYLNFLKSGSTKKPIDLLKDAGVNLTNQKVINNAFDFAKNIIEKWKNLQ